MGNRVSDMNITNLLKKEDDPAVGEKKANDYADTVGMDDANRKVLEIFATEGKDAAVKAMFTGDKGEQLSYSEMRSRYG